jgi:hypothetical protein
MYLVCYEKGKEVACKSIPAIRQVPSIQAKVCR